MRTTRPGSELPTAFKVPFPSPPLLSQPCTSAFAFLSLYISLPVALSHLTPSSSAKAMISSGRSNMASPAPIASRLHSPTRSAAGVQPRLAAANARAFAAAMGTMMPRAPSNLKTNGDAPVSRIQLHKAEAPRKGEWL